MHRLHKSSARQIGGRPPLLPRRGAGAPNRLRRWGRGRARGCRATLRARTKATAAAAAAAAATRSDAARPGKPGFRMEARAAARARLVGKVYAGLNLCTAETFAVKLLNSATSRCRGQQWRQGDGSLEAKRMSCARSNAKSTYCASSIIQTSCGISAWSVRQTDRGSASFSSFARGSDRRCASWRLLGSSDSPLCSRYGPRSTYLHAQNIIHRDVKGGNLLIDRGVVKLADFGCSKVTRFMGEMSESQHTAVGTMQFMAPEVMKSQDVGGSSPSPRAHTPAARSSPELDIVVSDIDNSLEEIVEELDVSDDCKHGDDDEDEASCRRQP